MTDAGPARLLVLDRDGVINRTTFDDGRNRPPWALDEVALLPTAGVAVEAAINEGFTVVVVTNQPDIARGRVSRELVDRINERIAEQIPGVSRFYVCPHDNSDGCPCRKPQPGMLLEAMKEFNAVPGQSWMVGDRWTDVAAGHAAGLRTALLEDESSWRQTSQGPAPSGLKPNIVASNLEAALNAILGS